MAPTSSSLSAFHLSHPIIPLCLFLTSKILFYCLLFIVYFIVYCLFYCLLPILIHPVHPVQINVPSEFPVLPCLSSRISQYTLYVQELPT